MSDPTFVENCVEAIRKSTYGREMRKPLADGLEDIKTYHIHEGIVFGDLAGVSVTALSQEDYYRLNVSIR